MADTYEKDLAQKSSLTTSDFIRVVGSDNVSYKQRVSNVAETFAQALPRYSAVTSLKDWATATNGRGITITNSATTDTPSQTSNKYGVAWTNSYSDGTSPWANLFWSPTGSTDIYMCQKTNTSAWSDWVKMPTRTEVDALKTYTSYTHNATVGSVSFQVLTKVYGDGLKIVQLSSTSSVSLSTSGWANAVSNYPISLTTIAIATGKGEIMVRTSGGALQINATDFSGYLLGTGVSY